MDPSGFEDMACETPSTEHHEDDDAKEEGLAAICATATATATSIAVSGVPRNISLSRLEPIPESPCIDQPRDVSVKSGPSLASAASSSASSSSRRSSSPATVSSSSSSSSSSSESQNSLWTRYSPSRSSHTSYSRTSDVSSSNPDPLVFENFIFQKVMPEEDTSAEDAAVVFFELLNAASQGRVMLHQRLSLTLGGDLIVRSR